MKPIAILLAVNAALIAIGAFIFGAGDRASGRGIKVGLVFDIGGKNDQSFNEAAYRGLERAQTELGAEVTSIEPSEGADRATALRSLAERGEQIVFGVGYLFGPDLERTARDFPDVKFVGIDYAPAPGTQVPPNLEGIAFREQDGSYLVGAIAGLLTKTKRVGFIGGMDIPLIRKFEAGFAAGVASVCADCRVSSVYVGSDPRAFTDPVLGAQLASAQYDRGVDIIFHAAGKTGNGVIAAARRRDAWVIGVDSDQYAVAPCCVVTSMVKRVDLAVVRAIADVGAGQFHAGTHELGLDGNFVAFVADERNRDLLPLAIVQRARGLRDQIIAGAIVVPTQ